MTNQTPVKVYLQKFTQKDFDLFYSLVKDPMVMKYITGHPLSIFQAQEKFNNMLGQNQSMATTIGNFKVFNGNNEFLGHVKLVWSNFDSTKLEIGYVLKQEFWNKGYGTSICKELLRIGQQEFPDTKIIALIDPNNKASYNLLSKFGFTTLQTKIIDQQLTQILQK
ncbi:GNAT family N-acetyltransferase [Myroides sp. LJL119]